MWFNQLQCTLERKFIFSLAVIKFCWIWAEKQMLFMIPWVISGDSLGRMGGSQPLEAVDACRPLCHVERTRVGAGGSWRNQGLNSVLLPESRLSPKIWDRQTEPTLSQAWGVPTLTCPWRAGWAGGSSPRARGWSCRWPRRRWGGLPCAQVQLPEGADLHLPPGRVQSVQDGPLTVNVIGKSLGWWGWIPAQRSSGKAEWWGCSCPHAPHHQLVRGELVRPWKGLFR